MILYDIGRSGHGVFFLASLFELYNFRFEYMANNDMGTSLYIFLLAGFLGV